MATPAFALDVEKTGKDMILERQTPDGILSWKQQY